MLNTSQAEALPIIIEDGILEGLWMLCSKLSTLDNIAQESPIQEVGVTGRSLVLGALLITPFPLLLIVFDSPFVCLLGVSV